MGHDLEKWLEGNGPEREGMTLFLVWRDGENRQWPLSSLLSRKAQGRRALASQVPETRPQPKEKEPWP